MIYELWFREEFPKLSLMFNDWVLHTNELGGYAGALMIYNYLYRKSPVTTTTNSYFLNNYSNQIPGFNNTQKTANLNKMKTVANELVNGNRAYRGSATVSL